MRPNAAFLIGISAGLACCSGPPAVNAGAPPPRPKQWIEATSDEVVERFVRSHPDGDVPSLFLHRTECGPEGFAHLRRLRGLTELTLQGPWTSDPVAWVEGKPRFKTALSDAAVREICRIESLQVLKIWYGSLSNEQKKMVESALPGCRVVENINKL